MSHCTPGELKGVIILYHGFSACPNYYNEIADKLQDECWHIYLPLTIGHGYNQCASNDTSCASGIHLKFNLTQLPTSREPYIDFINMMNTIIKVVKEHNYLRYHHGTFHFFSTKNSDDDISNNFVSVLPY